MQCVSLANALRSSLNTSFVLEGIHQLCSAWNRKLATGSFFQCFLYSVMFPRYSWEHSGDKEACPARDHVTHFDPNPLSTHTQKDIIKHSCDCLEKWGTTLGIVRWEFNPPFASATSQPLRLPCHHHRSWRFRVLPSSTLLPLAWGRDSLAHSWPKGGEADMRDWIPPPAS